MGHQRFVHDEGSAGSQLRDIGADGRIDALDLHHLEFGVRALFQIGLGHRVQDALSGPVALAVMLLNVFHAGILPDEEAVDAVVFGIVDAAVVNAAARHDHHVAVLADVKIVVNGLLQAALAEHDRNVDRFVLRSVLDADVDAALIRLGNDVDVRRRPAAVKFSVRADVVGAFGNRVQVRNFFDEMSLDRV